MNTNLGLVFGTEQVTNLLQLGEDLGIRDVVGEVSLKVRDDILAGGALVVEEGGRRCTWDEWAFSGFEVPMMTTRRRASMSRTKKFGCVRITIPIY